MAKEEILNAEIDKVVIFVQLTDGTVRQVISTPGLKLMAVNFIAEHSEDRVIKLGNKENVEFHQLNSKEIKK